MSQLALLRDAIEKLDQAEDALFHARQSFSYESIEYRHLDGQYETVGDIKEFVKEEFHRLEVRLMFEAYHAPKVDKPL